MGVSNFIRCLRDQPISDIFNLLLVDLDVILRDHVSQKYKFGDPELTLLDISEEAFSKLGEQLTKVLQVLIIAVTIHKVVIKINISELANESLEHLFHQSHEGVGCVSEAEWHN